MVVIMSVFITFGKALSRNSFNPSLGFAFLFRLAFAECLYIKKNKNKQKKMNRKLVSANMTRNNTRDLFFFQNKNKKFKHFLKYDKTKKRRELVKNGFIFFDIRK